MTSISLIIIVTALLIALLYFRQLTQPVSIVRSCIKTAPMMLFALAAFFQGANAFFVTGLFLSALGDFGLSRESKSAFLYGLCAFALAHLLYILHFLNLSQIALYEAFVSAPLLAISLAGIVVSTEIWLAPHTNGLRWPVRIYCVIIGLMGLGALGTMGVGWGGSVFGAGLFILSDLILACSLFLLSPSHSSQRVLGYCIWGFYVLGQFLLLCGAVFGLR